MSMRNNTFTRWLQGRHRQIAQARLLGYQPLTATPLRSASKAMLACIAALYTACMLATCAPAPAHAQQAALVPRAAQQYQLALRREAQLAWGLRAPVAAFAAQVHQESGWQPRATSQVGAQGMAQFMPATARWWCELHKLSATDCQPTNPTWALRSLVGYDKYLYDRTPQHYSHYDRLWVALRAYNGGLGHWKAEAAVASRVQKQFPTRQQADAACGTARRSPVHCAENLGYPRRILVGLQPRYASWGGVVQ
jgi:soluble lytic murein transglycosylase-like protein